MDLERYTQKAQQAILDAQQRAMDFRHSSVEPVHLLLALLRQAEGVAPAIATRIAGSPSMLVEELERDLAGRPKVYGGGGRAGPPRATAAPPPRAALAGIRGSQRVVSATPETTYQALEKYGRDLTQLARQGKLDPVIGRDEEIRRVIQVLSRRTKNNPALIGDPGVGKTAIVEGLAQRIVNGDVPEGLKKKRLVQLDLGALVAGAEDRGGVEGGVKAVLKEVTDAAGEVG